MNHHSPSSPTPTDFNVPLNMNKPNNTTTYNEVDSAPTTDLGATSNSPTTRLIYIVCRGKLEKLEISDRDTAEDIKDLLRGAAHAGPHDIVKLFDASNVMFPVTPRILPNRPENAYRVEIVITSLSHSTSSSSHQKQNTPQKKKTFLQSAFNSHSSVMSGSSCDHHAQEIDNLVQRLSKLESQVYPAGNLAVITDPSGTRNTCVGIIEDLCKRMDETRNRLLKLERISWMGFHSSTTPVNPGESSPEIRPTMNSIRKTQEECQKVWKRFTELSQKCELNESVRICLRQTDFNNWNWEDAELVYLMKQMYIDLEFHIKFNIELAVLEKWLFRVYEHYNHVPFHNFKHAFMVAQMMYAIIWKASLWTKFDQLDVFSLLTGAICHDLDHPGYNNVYQINARTQLALRYNDVSPLENHHSAVTFDILNQHECCILKNLGVDAQKRARESIIRCILATDMARHNEILKDFREVLPTFDFDNKDHKNLLMMVLIKVSDISNEARPIKVSEPWLNCLLEEFFQQSDTEKLEGLPVTPFMDRDKVTRSSSQCGFIKFVILPLFESLGQLLPILEEPLIAPVRRQLEYYTELQKKDQMVAGAPTGSSSVEKCSISESIETDMTASASKNGITNDGSSRKSSISPAPSATPSSSSTTKT